MRRNLRRGLVPPANSYIHPVTSSCNARLTKSVLLATVVAYGSVRNILKDEGQLGDLPHPRDHKPPLLQKGL